MLLHYNFPAEKIGNSKQNGIVVVPFAGKESKDYFILTCRNMPEPQLNSLYSECIEGLRKKDFEESKGWC